MYKLVKFISDKLVHQLEEYVCSEAVNDYEILSSLEINSENLRESIQLAHQLQNMCALQGPEALKLSKPQLNLALKLEKAISSLSEMEYKDNAELKVLNSQNELHKANKIIHDLKDTLHNAISFTLSQVDEQTTDLDETKLIVSQDPVKNEATEMVEKLNLNSGVTLSSMVEVYENLSDTLSPDRQNVIASSENIEEIITDANIITVDENDEQLKTAESSIIHNVNESENIQLGVFFS